MDNKFTEEFPLDRFINTSGMDLDEFLDKFYNERKADQLKQVKKSYSLEEFLDEFPKSNEFPKNDGIKVIEDVSGNLQSER